MLFIKLNVEVFELPLASNSGFPTSLLFLSPLNSFPSLPFSIPLFLLSSALSTPSNTHSYSTLFLSLLQRYVAQNTGNSLRFSFSVSPDVVKIVLPITI